MNETTALIVLALLAAGKLPLAYALQLYRSAGSASAAIDNIKNIRDIIPDASATVVSFLNSDISPYISKAMNEESWCKEHGVDIISIDDESYPQRLKGCNDAPLVLFVRGKCDFNASRIVNIVGTRQCTAYGKDFIERFISDIKGMCSDLIIVSGLAYGVDINAHRASLANGIRTVGVVAHGHDRLYPQLHTPDADRMISSGGAVITEYACGTRPDARNFLQRNRIIAGMSDATIVVESASHGGGLVTARLAQDYGREVFAVPGPVNSEYSKGCNNLIRDDKAALITCAQDVMNAMSWQNDEALVKARKQGIERTLFPTFSPEEQAIVDVLRTHGDCQTNILAQHTGLSISNIVSLLFSLEMKGIVTSQSGNTFHLIG